MYFSSFHNIHQKDRNLVHDTITNNSHSIIQMQISEQSKTYFSLYIKINRAIDFGKAIFIVGNCEELGNWNISSKNRLDWTEGDNWRRMFNLKKGSRLEYKYAIGDYHCTNAKQLEWESGSNRSIGEDCTHQNQIYLNQRWNMQCIKINLVTNTAQYVEEVYVLGNTVELGMKISKQTMFKIKSEDNVKSFNQEFIQNWSIKFHVDKSKPCINYYYYAKINDKIEKIREPGKYFSLDSDHAKNLIDRQRVIEAAGHIEIVEHQNFGGFKISKLNEKMFIGPYIKKVEDFQVLKNNKVKAILNLQSNSDMAKYNVNWNFIKEQAFKNNIEAFNFQIVDMNFYDFINKSSRALNLLNQLIDSYGCVYIHCTAGIYRSPQLAILYLVRFEKYDLGKAMDFVKEKRPYAHPYLDCLKWALDKVESGISKFNCSIKSLLCY